MTEYKIGSATVRIHGTPDRDKIREATEKFMKGVMKCEKQKKKSKIAS